jgi:hypothetical protein
MRKNSRLKIAQFPFPVGMGTCRLIFTSPLWLLCLLGACASYNDIKACNDLAYSQAPPLMDNRYMFGVNRCFGSLSTGMGKTPGAIVLPNNLAMCDLFMEKNDANLFDRRAIFDACMTGKVSPEAPARTITPTTD